MLGEGEIKTQFDKFINLLREYNTANVEESPNDLYVVETEQSSENFS